MKTTTIQLLFKLLHSTNTRIVKAPKSMQTNYVI